MKTLWTTLFLFGCNGNGGDVDPNSPKYSQQQPNGVERPEETPHAVFTGSLNNGSAINLDFAQDVYCFPATENENFNGHHVLYEYEQPKDTHITVIATPENGLDVSLYVIQTGPNTTFWPPNVTGGGGTICEAEYDQSNDNNPSKPEGTFIGGWDQPYRLIIGIAGAGGTEEGNFKAEIWESGP